MICASDSSPTSVLCVFVTPHTQMDHQLFLDVFVCQYNSWLNYSNSHTQVNRGCYITFHTLRNYHAIFCIFSARVKILRLFPPKWVWFIANNSHPQVNCGYSQLFYLSSHPNRMSKKLVIFFPLV